MHGKSTGGEERVCTRTLLELDSDYDAVLMFVCFNLCVPSYTQLTRPDIILTFVAFKQQNYLRVVTTVGLKSLCCFWFVWEIIIC